MLLKKIMKMNNKIKLLRYYYPNILRDVFFEFSFDVSPYPIPKYEKSLKELFNERKIKKELFLGKIDNPNTGFKKW